MSRIISRCGYRCDLCATYAPNIASDADKQRMSQALAKYFDSQIEPQDLGPCAGCLKGDGDPDCQVRACAEQKGLENCAHCEAFACEKLRARMNVVEQRVNDVESIPRADYDLYIKPYLAEQRLLRIRQRLDKA